MLGFYRSLTGQSRGVAIVKYVQLHSLEQSLVMKRVLVYSMLFLKSIPLKSSLLKFEVSFLVHLLQGKMYFPPVH